MSLSKSLLVVLALATSAAGSAFAADRYIIDPEHTYSSFEYHHWGLSYQRGRFDSNSGMIELDLEAKTGAINMVIDAGSVSTGSEIFDKILRSDNFFDTAQFPQILFKSSNMRFDGDKLVQVDGELTIKGVTRPASFEITHFNCRFMFIYFKQACGANGFTKILRSDFGVGRYVPFVSDEVTLSFSVEGIRD
ncbi:YceI family protein [Undibacterium sp.]|uniref:YceI family protein n=1 Tax=Undibacterium sp. TaxID=1914977 RepID=UPI002CC66E48|nr:YceI family protein [Undibacterium sp.]HTD02984.1 YceI family protein [Undibacterium sp.]